ncbi:expressed unknown protein [Seminavis robusta]|uniref:Uncharacterized protein n=1 Tax=Seminavis robusta TaxID=568900 RepID=A0A9N8EN79_9STRA|nr:expressed unknown protein [Seminavis robusta]|eukprot:Sro1301_g260790.1 n/a (169) ;mRNA; f:7869-8375
MLTTLLLLLAVVFGVVEGAQYRAILNYKQVANPDCSNLGGLIESDISKPALSAAGITLDNSVQWQNRNGNGRRLRGTTDSSSRSLSAWEDLADAKKTAEAEAIKILSGNALFGACLETGSDLDVEFTIQRDNNGQNNGSYDRNARELCDCHCIQLLCNTNHYYCQFTC